VSPAGATLYVTASPCYDCAKAILRVGIQRVIYGQAYASRYGLSEDVAQFLKGSGCLFHPLILDPATLMR
jgi:dCMP deaminase